jgi:hypothetical protein
MRMPFVSCGIAMIAIFYYPIYVENGIGLYSQIEATS